MFFIFFLIFVSLCTGPSTDLVAFLQILGIGALLSGGLFLFCKKMFGFSRKKEKLLWKILPYILSYYWFLFLDIIKANISVLIKICSKDEPKGAIVLFHSKMKTDFANTLLANAITLTPGTISVHLENGHFTVHCLSNRFTKGLTTSKEAKYAMKIDGILSSESSLH